MSGNKLANILGNRPLVHRRTVNNEESHSQRSDKSGWNLCPRASADRPQHSILHRNIFRMGDQTKVSERNGSPPTAPKALARDVGEFAYDVFTLAELQIELFGSDVQECGRRVFVPGLVLLCGTALGLAGFPVALAAIALFWRHVWHAARSLGNGWYRHCPRARAGRTSRGQ